MPKTSILFGRLLLLLGIAGYVYGLVATEHASPTALIPAVFGIILLILGYLANKKENLRKHLMHAAILVALLGFIAVAIRLVPRLGELTLSAAVISQLLMAVICLLFVVLAVKSFVDARR